MPNEVTRLAKYVNTMKANPAIAQKESQQPVDGIAALAAQMYNSAPKPKAPVSYPEGTALMKATAQTPAQASGGLAEIFSQAAKNPKLAPYVEHLVELAKRFKAENPDASEEELGKAVFSSAPPEIKQAILDLAYEHVGGEQGYARGGDVFDLDKIIKNNQNKEKLDAAKELSTKSGKATKSAVDSVIRAYDDSKFVDPRVTEAEKNAVDNILKPIKEKEKTIQDTRRARREEATANKQAKQASRTQPKPLDAAQQKYEATDRWNRSLRLKPSDTSAPSSVNTHNTLNKAIREGQANARQAAYARSPTPPVSHNVTGVVGKNEPRVKVDWGTAKKDALRKIQPKASAPSLPFQDGAERAIDRQINDLVRQGKLPEAQALSEAHPRPSAPPTGIETTPQSKSFAKANEDLVYRSKRGQDIAGENYNRLDAATPKPTAEKVPGGSSDVLTKADAARAKAAEPTKIDKVKESAKNLFSKSSKSSRAAKAADIADEMVGTGKPRRMGPISKANLGLQAALTGKEAVDLYKEYEKYKAGQISFKDLAHEAARFGVNLGATALSNAPDSMRYGKALRLAGAGLGIGGNWALDKIFDDVYETAAGYAKPTEQPKGIASTPQAEQTSAPAPTEGGIPATTQAQEAMGPNTPPGWKKPEQKGVDGIAKVAQKQMQDQQVSQPTQDQQVSQPTQDQQVTYDAAPQQPQYDESMPDQAVQKIMSLYATPQYSPQIMEMLKQGKRNEMLNTALSMLAGTGAGLSQRNMNEGLSQANLLAGNAFTSGMDRANQAEHEWMKAQIANEMAPIDMRNKAVDAYLGMQGKAADRAAMLQHYDTVGRYGLAERALANQGAYDVAEAKNNSEIMEMKKRNEQRTQLRMRKQQIDSRMKDLISANGGIVDENNPEYISLKSERDKIDSVLGSIEQDMGMAYGSGMGEAVPSHPVATLGTNGKIIQ